MPRNCHNAPLSSIGSGSRWSNELKPVSIGVVGAGDIARKIHLPVLRSMNDVRVAWIYDSSVRRAGELGAAYGIRPLPACAPEELPPSDLVLLAVPVEARAGYLAAYAAGNTGLFCEKPFAMSAAEHRQATDLYPAHRLGCGYMRRFYDSTRTMQHLITQGWFGDLLRVRIAEGNRSRGTGSDGSFLSSASSSSSRGVLTDLGSHSIDLALYLTQAQGFRIRGCELVLDGRIDRRASADIELLVGQGEAARTIGLQYCVSWLDPQPNQLELHFEHAAVFCGLAPGAEVFVGDPRRPTSAFRICAPVRAATTANQAFYLEWRAFIDGFAEQRESLVSARSALMTTALVEALHQQGRRADA